MYNNQLLRRRSSSNYFRYPRGQLRYSLRRIPSTGTSDPSIVDRLWSIMPWVFWPLPLMYVHIVLGFWCTSIRSNMKQLQTTGVFWVSSSLEDQSMWNFLTFLTSCTSPRVLRLSFFGISLSLAWWHPVYSVSCQVYTWHWFISSLSSGLNSRPSAVTWKATWEFNSMPARRTLFYCICVVHVMSLVNKCQ